MASSRSGLSRELLANLGPAELAAFVSQLSLQQLLAIKYDWRLQARPKQLRPERPFSNWLVMAGRGFGKTKTGAETTREWVDEGFQRLALIGPTMADVRDIMITGEAVGPGEGLLNVFPPHQRPIYNSSKRVVKFHTGAKAFAFSAEEPERLRGPQNEKSWCDEICSWQRAEETWSNLRFNLRRGRNPQKVITSTPKPSKLLREIIADPNTILTRGSTFENSENLNEAFLLEMEKLRGTRIGRQELEAEILEDLAGALWTLAMIDDWRVTRAPEFTKIVTAVDPSTTSNEMSDECGIVTVGRDLNRHKYPIRDSTMRGRPREWATRAVRDYWFFGSNYIVAEANQGGLMVKEVIEAVDPRVAVKLIHATVGKRPRAEPISAEYERGLWHHVGVLEKLEAEQTGWIPDGKKSPNRVDALVWAGHELNDELVRFGARVL